MSDEEPREKGAGRRAASMPMCPMGETGTRMMESPPSGFLIFIPGGVFIVVGILIVVEPVILVWLIAMASILAGIAMLGCAYFMRAFGRRLMRRYR